jgi:membrane-bound hydrogenase subunit beta
MTVDELLALLSARLGDDLTTLRTVEHCHGENGRPIRDLWVEFPIGRLRDAISALCEATSPHLTVISGDDLGDRLVLHYHFNVGWGAHYAEIALALRTTIPKSDLRIPSISDLVPGALTSEREKREFYGLTVDGIPDDRNLFLPEEMTAHPWRKDEEAVGHTKPLVKRLVKWETRDA